MIADSDLRIFKVVLPDREFILRTPNATETKRWLSLIQLLIDEIDKIKRLSLDFSEEPRNRSSTKKNWKMENLDKEAYKVVINKNRICKNQVTLIMLMLNYPKNAMK